MIVQTHKRFSELIYAKPLNNSEKERSWCWRDFVPKS